jgi:hypothetical protein
MKFCSRGFLMVLVLVTSMVGASSASGSPYEPNDNAAQAAPLIGGGPFDAALETENDVDWYTFYVLGPTQLHIDFFNTAPLCTSYPCANLSITLLDHLTNELTATPFTEPTKANEINRSVSTGQYYVTVTSCCKNEATYELRFDPANAIVGYVCYSTTLVARAQGSKLLSIRRKLRHTHGRSRALLNRSLRAALKRKATLDRERLVVCTSPPA